MVPMPTFDDFEGVNSLVIDQRGYAEVIRCLADRTLKRGGRGDARIVYNALVTSVVPKDSKVFKLISGAGLVCAHAACICVLEREEGLLRSGFRG